MAGQRGIPQKGFMPGPQGQYQGQQAPLGVSPGELAGGYRPQTAQGSPAGALGGGGRLGLGSNIGVDTVGSRTMGGFGGPVAPPLGAGSDPMGGAGMGRGPLGPVNIPAPPPPPPPGNMMAEMPDTTTATHIPPEPYMDASAAATSVPGYPPTPGSLTKLPGGGYRGMGPRGTPITYGKVMPGPIRRA